MTRPEFSDLLARAEALGRDFARSSAAHDESGEFPTANFQALFEAGLLSLTMAAEHGGQGGGLREALAAVSSVSRGDPSTGLVFAMHLSHHRQVRGGKWPAHLVERVTKANLEGVALINSAQVEPDVGSPSHGALPATIARRDGEFWRITGRKTYATGIPLLKWATILAVTDEPTPRLGSFLVPTDAPGLSVERTWNASGMRATRSDDIILEDIRIPYADSIDLAPASQGVRRDPREAAWYFGLVPAVYDGAAQAARDWLVEFAATRAPGSLGAPLSTLPRFQDGLGRIELLLGVNRRLLRGLAEDYDLGRDFGGDAGIVKHAVIENAQEITTLALDLGGNPGFSRDNPLERHHRNALGGRVHAPQNNLIRTGLGRAAFAAFAAAQPAKPALRVAAG